jgi:hypothetical protein
MKQSMLGLMVFVATLHARAGAMPPDFHDYPVSSIYRGRSAPVDLASHAIARQFRTMLRAGVKGGPNFAGRWTVVRWGCGNNCLVFAVVDAISGRVYPGPGPYAAALDLDFRLDSHLLVVDPPAAVEAELPDSPMKAVESRYYVWHGDGQWELVHRIAR